MRTVPLLMAVALSFALAGPRPASAEGSVPSPAAELSQFADTPLELPDFAPEPVASSSVLPPLDLPESVRRGRLAEADKVYVPGFHIVGSAMFAEDELLEVTAPYAGRMLSYEEVRSVGRLLTLYYVERGYVTSGATLSRIREDGSVEFRITEGVLEGVHVAGQRYFRESYLSSRAAPRDQQVVNVMELERRLKALQEDPRIERVEAQLRPGSRAGAAELEIEVFEGRPFAVGLEFSNYQSPGVGPQRGQVRLAHLNLTGNGDTLEGAYSRSDGLRNVQLGYRLPLNRFDTTLGLRFTRTETENQEKPFKDLDIRSESSSYAIDFEQPVYRSISSSFSLSASAEYRTSQVFLFGEGFAFSDGLEPNGESMIAVLRLGQNYTYRDQQQVLALQSTLSVGVDALDATVGGPGPDGRFVTWLGRARWARRLPLADATLIARADVQLSNDALFGLEQFSVGGATSVRGYRENTLLRDVGMVGSLEVRIPVWRRASGEPWLEIAPFFDYGSSRNRDRPTPGLQSISSAGMGLIARLSEKMRVELYFGEDLTDVPESSDEKDLQDRGVHFRIRGDLF